MVRAQGFHARVKANTRPKEGRLSHLYVLRPEDVIAPEDQLVEDMSRIAESLEKILRTGHIGTSFLAGIFAVATTRLIWDIRAYRR